jgi:NAD(P)H dehydrogenase (quinone)
MLDRVYLSNLGSSMLWFLAAIREHPWLEYCSSTIPPTVTHFGMTVVGLPYSFQGQMKLDEVTGGSPYGATTIAGSQGERQPSATELDGARFQGKLIAQTAKKLFPG